MRPSNPGYGAGLDTTPRWVGDSGNNHVDVNSADGSLHRPPTIANVSAELTDRRANSVMCAVKAEAVVTPAGKPINSAAAWFTWAKSSAESTDTTPRFNESSKPPKRAISSRSKLSITAVPPSQEPAELPGTDSRSTVPNTETRRFSRSDAPWPDEVRPVPRLAAGPDRS